MADKEAKITLGVDGANTAKTNVNAVTGAFNQLVGTLENVLKLGNKTSAAITNIKPFDPGRAIQSAEQTRLAVQRLAIDAGVSVDTLTKRFDSIGEKVGISTNEVTNLATELGRLTLDPKNSVDALEAMGVEANNTNRSLHEMVGIGAALHNDLRVPLEGIGREFAQINRMAAEAGTTGGGKGLQQLLASLAPELSKFDTATEEARHMLEAFVALAAGKLPHQQATGAAGSILGALAGNAGQIGKYLGHDVHTESGGIDVQAYFDLQTKINRTRGRDSQLRVLTQLFGGDRKTALNFMQIGNLRNVQDLSTGREEAATARKFGINTPGVAAYDLNKLTSDQIRRANERAAGTTDNLAGTAAGEAQQLDIARDNAERNMAEDLLKSKDKFRRGFKGDAKGRVRHDTAVGMLPDIAQGVVTGVEAADAYSNRNLPEGEYKTGRDIQMDRLLKETEKTNLILQQMPQKTGEQLRSDPNNLGVDKARSRPTN